MINKLKTMSYCITITFDQILVYLPAGQSCLLIAKLEFFQNFYLHGSFSYLHFIYSSSICTIHNLVSQPMIQRKCSLLWLFFGSIVSSMIDWHYLLCLPTITFFAESIVSIFSNEKLRDLFC